ncbi:unnamed protein product, partial [Prorocentrum cordatum]
RRSKRAAAPCAHLLEAVEGETDRLGSAFGSAWLPPRGAGRGGPADGGGASERHFPHVRIGADPQPAEGGGPGCQDETHCAEAAPDRTDFPRGRREVRGRVRLPGPRGARGGRHARHRRGGGHHNRDVRLRVHADEGGVAIQHAHRRHQWGFADPARLHRRARRRRPRVAVGARGVVALRHAG